jgi:type IV pilus assembly protein PilC
MAEFVIKLADERGRIQEQTHAAASAEELRQRFTQAGYHVFNVRSRGGGAMGKKKVKLETFLIFNQQFLTLIKAGLPIHGSLEMLAKNQKNPLFSGQLMNVTDRVKTGESLSSAFEAQGGFSTVYTTTLLAGERSGNLQEVLERFVSFQRISLTFRKKLTASLIYPCVLIVIVICLFIFLITFVVPSFATLYDQMGTHLPWLTTMLLQFGVEAQHKGPYVLLVLAGLGYLAFRYFKTPKGSEQLDTVRIRLPLFGKIWIKYQVALFARTLSTLLTGGLPLVPSLETSAKSIASLRIAKAVFNAIVSVREGKSLADSLTRTKVFPGVALEMITVGEQTGALPQMLNSVSEFFEEDVETTLTAAMALIEPLILLVMGVFVVIILIALYLPIFSLGQVQQMQH